MTLLGSPRGTSCRPQVNYTECMSDLWERYRLPNDLSFEGWVDYVFDHPVLEPHWWWQDPESGLFQDWDESAQPARTLSYLTELFLEPAGLIERFTRAQIDQGLNFLVSSSCSNHMFVLLNKELPWADRRACIDAMIPLYRKLMAPVYGDDLGYVGQTERPTFACYMWWDVITISGGLHHCDRERINTAVLNVFERVLELKAESCIESVLHGLGHWHLYLPERTELIVRQFLTRGDISQPLRRYAEHAAIGAVQ